MRIFEVNYTRLVDFAFFTASRWFTNASKQNILDSGNMSDCTIFLESMHVYQVHLMPEFQRLSPWAFMQSFYLRRSRQIKVCSMLFLFLLWWWWWGTTLNHPCTVFKGVKSENFV